MQYEKRLSIKATNFDLSGEMAQYDLKYKIKIFRLLFFLLGCCLGEDALSFEKAKIFLVSNGNLNDDWNKR
jgi:hypothetical protein